MLSTALLTIGLGIVASVAVGCALRCAALERRVEQLLKGHAHFDDVLRGLHHTITNQTGAQLRAELDDLRGAVQAMQATHRRELGKLWGRIGAERSQNVAPNGHDTDEPELAALLELQRAAPAKP